MKSYAENAKFHVTKSRIIDKAAGWDVMANWEAPMMKVHADIVCGNGGHILELGFGMGISANFIQEHNIESHTIIEVNPGMYAFLEHWAEDKPNVIPVKGNWYDDIPTDRKYDGIFYDCYGDMVNKRYFPTHIMQYCKPGTIITWFNNFLQAESQYDGVVKFIDSRKHVEQFDDKQNITFHPVTLEIPDSARVDWYLKGEGNTYYAPKLVVNP